MTKKKSFTNFQRRRKSNRNRSKSKSKKIVELTMKRKVGTKKRKN